MSPCVSIWLSVEVDTLRTLAVSLRERYGGKEANGSGHVDDDCSGTVEVLATQASNSTRSTSHDFLTRYAGMRFVFAHVLIVAALRAS